MREYILQQLRACSCIRGKQRTWISDLTDEQLYELFIRLRNGETAKSIARHVQQAWGVNPTSSIHALSQGILKFNRRIAHLLITPTTGGVDRCSGTFTGDLAPEDTLASLDHIANLHRARIKAMLEEEENTGVKYPYLNRDLQALATLQKLIIKQKLFEMLHDDPVKQRRLAGLEKEIQHKFDSFMGQIGEDERIKMAEALGNALEYLETIAIRGEIGPDGNVRLIESKNDS